ncbi:MAG TPA: hypothetical protein VFT16_05000, partial [Candidatus Saccharimonadales bacterium]|nr:hypothetical protein [Candidatus Saccharimonadales bacterium]
MKQVCKRFGFGIAAVISFLTTVSVLFPQQAAAAGETFTWKDYNTITVSGGDLKGSYQYKLIQGSSPHRFNAAPDLPEHKRGCDVGFTITLNDDKSGRISYPLPKIPEGDSARPTGAVYCNDMKVKEVCTGVWPFRDCHNEWDGPRFPGVSEDYNRSITINGTRPGSNQQTETEQQKEVTVMVNSPNPNSSSGQTIELVIKDASGKVVSTAEPVKEPALGSDDPNSDRFVDPAYQPVYYLHTFKLEPGKYTVCGTIVITDCRSFTKVKFEPLSLVYGDNSVDRRLTVEVIATYIGGPQDMTVGPFEVNVQHPGGLIVTQETDTQSHKMSNEEEQAQGGVTVEYELATRTVFNGLEPATYEVCVVGVEECQDVIKKAGEEAKVTFKIDWLKYSADNTYERDCREKYNVMGVRAVTFLVCSAIDTGSYVVGVMDSVIGNLLTVDTTDLFNDSDTNNAYHTAWNSFRAFALGLIVIAALIMVVSQAAGIEILDAY